MNLAVFLSGNFQNQSPGKCFPIPERRAVESTLQRKHPTVQDVFHPSHRIPIGTVINNPLLGLGE
jgi:hypothetical protein